MPEASEMLKKLLWIMALAFGTFILVTASGVAWMQGNWMFAIGLLIGGLFLYWFLDERDADDAAADTAERVAERSEGLFGGLIGGTGAFLVGVTAVAMTVLDQLMMVVDVLISMTIGSPLLASTLAAIGGIFGLSAMLGLNASTAGLLIAVLLVSVVLLRRRLRRAVAETAEAEDD